MMHMGNFGGMGFGGFGWIFMILFWVLVILGIIYLTKYLVSGTGNNTGKETALDILKKRYASGAISRDEYNGKKDVISQKS